MKRLAAKTVAVMGVIVMLVMTAAVPASAISAVPYDGYNYDPYGVATASPAGYLPDGLIDYTDMGLEKPLASPEDLFVYDNVETGEKEIWIADTKNSRIVQLDQNYKYVTEYSVFTDETGKEWPLTEPQCVYVKRNEKEEGKGYDEIFVCCNVTVKDEAGKDKKAGYVVTANREGKVKHTYTNPNNPIAEIKDFQPLAVVADNSDYVYVLAYGVLEGLIVYHYESGEFSTFYGANKVVLTWRLLIEQTWKKIFSREAADTMIKAVPTEMSNIFIDDEGFIFTTTETATVEKELRVRKLNATGTNTLKGDENALVDVVFGERETGVLTTGGSKTTIDTRLTDITVGDDGVIACLDAERGRVYLYDQTCMLLTAFGYKATGNIPDGAVSNPTAIAQMGSNYMLLDASRGAIVTYRPTDYIYMLLEANEYFTDGYYIAGESYWRNVLKYDANFSRGYAAIGKSLLEQHKYEEALEWLKQGQDRTAYSLALAEYRKEYLRENYWWLLPVAVVCVVLFVMLIRFIQKLLGIKRKAKRIKFS